MKRFTDLATELRADADRLAAYLDERTAGVLRSIADRIERTIRDEADEMLTLEQASTESGYSVSRLRHLLADGELPQAGRRGAPRIRRGDLPRRPQRPAGPFNASEAARRVLERAG